MSLETGLLTLRDHWRWAVTRFAHAHLSFGHGCDNAVDEAAWLLLWALDLPRDDPLMLERFLDARLLREESERIMQLVEQRVSTRQPVAYLTGEAWLQGVRFRCDARALVPRSFIAELLADGLSPWLAAAPARIADMCTGGGSLAVLAARAFEAAEVDAYDLSAEALALAQLNVRDHGLQARVQLMQTDLFEGVRTRYDLIVCNPPYVTESAMRALPPEYQHEPRLALAAGADGMDIVARLLPQLRQRLNPNGIAVVEIGHHRAQFEARFPRLQVHWLSTSAGDDMVFLLEASAWQNA